MKENSTVMLVKIAGMVVIAFFLSFWIYTGLGEMSAGDWGGAVRLVVVALTMALMALAWKRPLTWSPVIMVMGLLLGLIFGLPDPGRLPYGMLLTSVPFLLGGLLLLLAGWMGRAPAQRRKKRGGW